MRYVTEFCREALCASLFLFLVGCPHPGPSPHSLPDGQADGAPAPSLSDGGTPTPAPSSPSCPAATTESPDAVCELMFTAKKVCANGTTCACVVCGGGSACVDHSVEIYCVATTCAAALQNGECVMAGGDIDAAKRPKAPAPSPGTAKPQPVVPKSSLTPGAADPRVTQDNIQSTICRPGYSKTVRPSVSVTNKIKGLTLSMYGLKAAAPGDYELDHLISLEIGGAPADIKNLWPEPWETRGNKKASPGTGAETKDKVENWLHKQICSGKLKLADAQRMEAQNWPGILNEMSKP